MLLIQHPKQWEWGTDETFYQTFMSWKDELVNE